VVDCDDRRDYTERDIARWIQGGPVVSRFGLGSWQVKCHTQLLWFHLIRFACCRGVARFRLARHQREAPAKLRHRLLGRMPRPLDTRKPQLSRATNERLTTDQSCLVTGAIRPRVRPGPRNRTPRSRRRPEREEGVRQRQRGTAGTYISGIYQSHHPRRRGFIINSIACH
jgi:hypothetical protein